MLRTASSQEACLVMHVSVAADYSQEQRQEFLDLTRSAGGHLLAEVFAINITPHAKYLLGSGKVNEVAGMVQSLGAHLVLVNHPLTPSQESALARRFKCRVLDRVGLILDIFAQRARTFEGKLQVELAQLQHLATRLVRGWTHLERQKGGIGLRGPGETQLETDRRLLRIRIRAIKEQLGKVRCSRSQNRRARRRAHWPVVAMVGYTNAGKSTLFNQLTGASVQAADRLFATLDPTLRRVLLPGGQQVIMADTVGFIRDLPHELIEAFRATLEEVQEADLLLHVVDGVRADRKETIEEVQKLLTDIHAGDLPQIMVYNKLDVAPDRWQWVNQTSAFPTVWVSGKQGTGLTALKQLLTESLFGHLGYYRLCLKAHEGRLRAQLYERQVVAAEQTDKSGGWQLVLHITAKEYQQLCWRKGGNMGRA